MCEWRNGHCHRRDCWRAGTRFFGAVADEPGIARGPRDREMAGSRDLWTLGRRADDAGFCVDAQFHTAAKSGQRALNQSVTVSGICDHDVFVRTRDGCPANADCHLWANL